MGRITNVILSGSGPEPWPRYGLAVLLVALVTVLRHALDPLLGDELPLLAFYANVLVTGWLLGTGPGLLAAALGFVIGIGFFMQPRGEWIDAAVLGWTSVVRYLLISALFLSITHALRKAEARATTQHQQVLLEREALRRSLDLLERIAQGTHDLIAAVDTQMRFTLVNPPYIREFGRLFGAEPRFGQTVDQILADRPEFLEQVRPFWVRALAGESFSVVQQFGDPKVKHAWWEISCYPVRSGRQIMGAALIGRNVSMRVQSLDALQKSELRLRRFFESDMVGTIYWTMDGRVIDANDKFLRMVGYTREDLHEGRIKWNQMTPPEYVAADKFALHELRTTGVDTAYEKEFYRKDGTRVPVIVGAALFDKTEQEGVAFVLDISDRKQAEAESMRGRERLEALIKNAPVSLAMFDRNMRYIRASDRWIIDVGLSHRDLTGEDHYELFPNLPEHFKQAHRRGLAGETVSGEDEWIAANGKLRSVRWKVQPWGDSGIETGGITIFVEDVTDERQAQQSLRQSEAKFRAVFEQSAIGMGRVRFSDARWIDVNAAFCQMLGYSRQELLETPWPQITHPDDVALDLIPFQRMSSGELENYSVEKRFIHKSGHHVWARLTLSLVRDVQGRPDYEVAIVEDITQRQKDEEALRESEERHRLAAEELRAIMDATPSGILVAHDPQCHVITGNQPAHELLGVPINNNISPTPDGKRTKDSAYFRIFQNGQEVDPDHLPMQVAGRTGQVVRDVELDIRRTDGVHVLVLINAAPLLAQDGTVRGVVGAFVDITDRKRIEQALRNSEERYRATFELAPVGIAHVGLDGRWLQFNNTLCAITGYPRDQLQTLTFGDITHPDDLEADWNQARQLLDGRIDGYTMEKRYVRKDGQIVWVSLNASLQRNAQGEPVHFLVGILDITKRKQVEQELRDLTRTLEDRVARRTADADRKTEQLRRLHIELTNTEQKQRKHLAQILHDGLQQLLVAAKMRIGLLQARMHDERLRHDVREIEELLIQAINDSRSLTAELSPPVLYDRGLITALDWLARYMEDKHRLRVHVIAEQDVEPDREELRLLLFQAARELLLNVRKYAGVSEATLKLSHCDGCIEMQVEDQGVGFDPVEAFRERTTGGYGLFSVRERLEVLDGHLEIHSAPGQGTRVRLEVPMGPPPTTSDLSNPAPTPVPSQPHRLHDLAPLEQTIIVEPQPQPLPAAPNGHPVHAPAAERAATTAPSENLDRSETPGVIRVVLADDHQILRQGLAGLLRSQPDIRVVGQASDGVEALELAHQLQPDIVVMDGSMPRMDGVTATHHIRREIPGTQVIGLSMHTEEDMAAAMRHAGACAYLRKDGPADRLITVIRECLRPSPIAAREP